MFFIKPTGQQEVLGDRVPVEDNTAPPEVPVPEASTSPEAAPVNTGDVQPAIRPSIDEMIQQLQREQDQRLVAEGRSPLASPPHVPLSSPNARAGPSRSNSGNAIY